MAFSTLLRPTLLAAGRSPRLERTITRIPVTRSVVKRFVAGESENDALNAARDLLSTGRHVSIDYLGEDTAALAQAQETVKHYLALLPLLGQFADPAADIGVRSAEVSLKLSALGQFLPRDGHRIALEHAHKICEEARRNGVWVTVDAEDHTTTDSTLSIVTELRREFPDLGTVLQAYLRRTEADCADFSGPGSRIRLCKGAYKEPQSVAYQGKAEIDAAYLRCLRILVDGHGYPMLATHDPAMIDGALAYTAQKGSAPSEFELQMLYGIRDPEQRRLVAQGHQLRVYIPYGEQWYGYFMRRLAERPANLVFFLRALISR